MSQDPAIPLITVTVARSKICSLSSAREIYIVKESFDFHSLKMDHKSEKQSKKKFFSGLVAPHLLLCVVLAALCAVLVFINLRMDRRISAFEDALKKLRREGKEASVNVSDVYSGLGTRMKRSAYNATPSQKSDFEKRLQAMEER